MVRREVVAAKAGRSRAWLNDAAKILLNPLDVFLADPKGRDLAIFYLFLAIQECIDLAAHCVPSQKPLVSDARRPLFTRQWLGHFI